MEPFISDGKISFPVRAFGSGGTPIQGAPRPFRLLGPTCDALDQLPVELEFTAAVALGDWVELEFTAAVALGDWVEFELTAAVALGDWVEFGTIGAYRASPVELISMASTRTGSSSSPRRTLSLPRCEGEDVELGCGAE